VIWDLRKRFDLRFAHLCSSVSNRPIHGLEFSVNESSFFVHYAMRLHQLRDCRPGDLAEVYLKAYRKLRKHVSLPSYLRFVKFTILHRATEFSFYHVCFEWDAVSWLLPWRKVLNGNLLSSYNQLPKYLSCVSNLNLKIFFFVNFCLTGHFFWSFPLWGPACSWGGLRPQHGPISHLQKIPSKYCTNSWQE